MRKLDTNKQIALGGMIIALNLLALYAAATLPAPRIALYFLSSLPVYILACEGAYLSAVVTYVATSALSFFLLPNPFALIPYALLLGHYGLFKTWIETKIQDRTARIIIKMLYCNLLLFLGAAAAFYLMDISFNMSVLGFEMPVYLLVALLQAALLAFDIIYSLCQRIYGTQIRPHVIGRR